MRVSAFATVHGSREWLVWADGRTYASLGPAASGIEHVLGSDVDLRRAIDTADDAERAFREAFAFVGADPHVVRDGDGPGTS